MGFFLTWTEAIINGLRMFILDTPSYFNVNCQEVGTLLLSELRATFSRGYETQTSTKETVYFLQNSLHALKPCVLRIPAYCYISDEVGSSDFRQSNPSHHCFRLLPFSGSYWLRDLHNDLYKSSCAFHCGVNPHRQVEPVLFGIQPFRWILCRDLLWKGNEGALLHNIHPSHTAKFHLLQLLKTFK